MLEGTTEVSAISVEKEACWSDPVIQYLERDEECAFWAFARYFSKISRANSGKLRQARQRLKKKSRGRSPFAREKQKILEDRALPQPFARDCWKKSEDRALRQSM